jgi:hypothetical protein
MQDTISAEIKKVGEVINTDLKIPNYQRPYRWTEENVRLLLEDIFKSWREGKNSYRIGSVIINDNKNTLNIVDGQQRITTILLLLKCLGSEIGRELRSELKYRHRDAKNAIILNKKYIDTWLKENLPKDKESFSKYLIDSCQFVQIKVADLSEAFQMFDSQNGRGKELQAYNLLKAYHIRAMEDNSFEEKVACDKTWEGAARFEADKIINKRFSSDLLKQVINEQVYRSRVWSRKEVAWQFEKNKIQEFKGITVGKNMPIDFPYQNRELLLFVVQNYFKSLGVGVSGIRSRFKSISPENVSAFSLLNQNIVNGKDFFDYIETYVEIYKHLFLAEYNSLKEFKKFTHDYCLNYGGSQRDGDRYLFEVYKSLIMLMFDKFGEDGVEKYYETLYLLVYRLRIEKEQVRYNSVADYPAKTEIFNIIENAKTFADMNTLEQMAYKKVICKKDVKQIIIFFIEKGIHLESTDPRKIDLKNYNL